MSKFRFTKNITPDDDGADVYWRVYWMLQDDAIASMLHDRVLQSLASGVQRAFTVDGKVPKYGIGRSNIMYYVKRTLIPMTPLDILGDRAKEHLANLAVYALFPEPDVEEKP